LDGRQPRRRAESACDQPLLHILSHHRAVERRRTRRRGGCSARARALDRGRQDSRLRHAVLHRRELADRERETDDPLSSADDRAGYRLGDRRAGARRPLLGGWGVGAPGRGPHSPHRPLGNVAPARARHGRSGKTHAAPGAEAADPRGRSQTGAEQVQAGLQQGRGGKPGKEIAPPSWPRAMAAANMSEAKRGSRRLNPEERKLWGEITRSVAPMRRVPAERTSMDAGGKAAPSSKAAPRVAPAITKSAPRLEPFDRRLKARLAPFDRRLKARLARGNEPLDGRIDLHGKTQTEAYAALLA